MGPDSIIHLLPFKQSPIKLSNFEASLSHLIPHPVAIGNLVDLLLGASKELPSRDIESLLGSIPAQYLRRIKRVETN